MKNFKQLILLLTLSFIRSDDQSLKKPDIFNREEQYAAWRLLLVLVTSRSHAAVGRHHIFQPLQISMAVLVTLA